MDDAMIDLMADEGMLRRRLDAYASTRLSPDAATSARLRARVLAVAHRQPAVVRGDTRLAVLPAPILDATGAAGAARPFATRSRQARGRGTMRRTAALLLAASLALGAVAGTAFAAAPGGALYGARLWVETLTLPVDPSARAVAELTRLTERLTEASTASAAGDAGAATAALRAYESIVSEATANAVAAGDDEVAMAALQAGVSRNVAVLTRLAAALPLAAQPAISRALQHAIEQSHDAIDAIGPGAGGPDGPGDKGNPSSGNGGSSPTDKPTRTPKPTDDPKPTKGGGPTGAPDPTKTPKPTKAPTAEPSQGGPGMPTSKPGGPRTPEPGATPRPTRRNGGG